jgi:hypothetical protein
MMATAVYDNEGAGVIAGTFALAPQFEGRLEDSERASQVVGWVRCNHRHHQERHYHYHYHFIDGPRLGEV